MKECPKCHGKCQEESESCAICGYKFSDSLQEITNEENYKMEKEENQMNIDNNNLTNNESDIDVYEVVEEGSKEVNGVENNSKQGKKKNKVGLAIILVVALLVLAGALIFGKNLFKKNNEDTIIKAFQKLLKANTLDADINLSIEDIEVEFNDSYDGQLALVASMMKDFNININTKYDKKASVIEGLVKLNMRNNTLVTGNLYMDKEAVGIEVPLIYDKMFYITWDGFYETLQEDSNLPIDIKSKLSTKEILESIDKIDIDKYEGLYKGFIKEIIKETKKESIKIGNDNVDCEKYNLQFTYLEVADFSLQFMNKVLGDKNNTERANDLIDSISNYIISREQYVYFDMTEEEFENKIKEYKEDPNKLIEDLNKVYEKMDRSKAEYINFDVDVYIDNDNTIRKVDALYEINGEATNTKLDIRHVTTINSINQELEFDGIDKTNTLNLLELDLYEMQQLIMDITNNVQDKFSVLNQF